MSAKTAFQRQLCRNGFCGPAAQFPDVVGVKLLENLSSRTGARRTLAAGASCEPALVFRSWLVPTRVFNSFAQALIRSDAVRYTRLLGSYTPFWSTVQDLRAMPRYAHILLAGAGGGGAEFAHTHA
jgi:hypothetical protein